MVELSFEHVSYDEYIQLEWIIRDSGGQFGRISIPAEISNDKFVFLWHVRGYPEVHEVVFHSDGGSRNVVGPPRIVAFVHEVGWVESFGIHRICIHHQIAHDTVAVKM